MNKLSIVLVAGSLLTGQTFAADANQDVAELYQQNCSICHGDKGNGETRARSGMTPKPRDFTTADAAIELTRERMIISVTHGRPGTAMMGHKGRLSADQISALVDYIRDKFMQVPVARDTGAPQAVSLGEKVYTENCSVCHGDKGNTAFWAKSGLNPPPRDFTSPEAQGNLTRERMILSVTNGRQGTGMVPFKSRLSTEEIAAVVGYIRFKFMGINPANDKGDAPLAQVAISPTEKPASKAKTTASSQKSDPHAGVQSGASSETVSPHAVPGMGMPGSISPGTMSSNPAGHAINVDMSEAIPGNLKGDAEWGRQFYMKNCFTCHGVTGDGNGPRAYFNRPPPRDFTSENSRLILNRPRLFDSISKGRVGTVMPAWNKVLTNQEIANLTEFVFQAFIKGKENQEKQTQGKATQGKKKAS